MKIGDYISIGTVNEYMLIKKNTDFDSGQIVQISNPKHRYSGYYCVIGYRTHKMAYVELLDKYKHLDERIMGGGVNGSAVGFMIRLEGLKILQYGLLNYDPNHYMDETRCVMG
jgi:hypothetical protein